MNSRLYEITYNEEQWSLQGSRNTRYKLVNKKTYESYELYGNVMGIMQITDDEFLVHRIIRCNEWEPGNQHQISRIWLKGSKPVVLFKHDFYHYFHFLTEDIILFDDDTLLYSISKNEKDDRLNHLISGEENRHDNSFLLKKRIKCLYDTKESPYPSYLLVEYKPHCYKCTEYLQLLLDANSFQIVTPVYSTLRNQYINLSDSLTLRNLVEEENHYLYIIDGFLNNLYNKDNTKSTEELLAMVQKTE